MTYRQLVLTDSQAIRELFHINILDVLVNNAGANFPARAQRG